ncbi:MAG TPA: SDR family oxidoreductase [Vicinamibacterales bacterium]|nr:SDR family oxidoreductase [Vicinamibacterales bacterium]
MASYLVTGGAGFIGSHLAEELLRRGHQVRIADNFVTGKRENIDAALNAARAVVPDLPGGAPELVTGDLADEAVARRAVEGVEFVLHQAAIPSVPRSVQDPVASNRANIDATLNVLVAARDAGVRRVVYAGSSSAFGDTPTLPKHEDMATNPLSPYALQKLVGEQYMRLFTRLYGLETVTIRYFNVFGPRQDPGSAYSGVISRFLLALTEGEQPVIFGDGEQTRDFTYVANVVDGVLRAVEVPAASGEVINVATGSRISLNELLRTLQRLTGQTADPRYEPPRAGDVRDSQADIGKAERLLGYRPLVHLDEGLRRTLAWFQQPAAALDAAPGA